MASPTDIRKGRVMVYQGAPHLVLEMQHRTQGRQAGFVQTTLRQRGSRMKRSCLGFGTGFFGNFFDQMTWNEFANLLKDGDPTAGWFSFF